MELNLLNQYLLVSTFEKLRHCKHFENFDVQVKKAYLNQKIKDDSLGFYSYSDAFIAVINEANDKKKRELIEKILATTDEYILKDMKTHPSIAEYIMIFFNYLYFDLYFGTEKLTNPKKIKSFIRNEKTQEFKDFKTNIIRSLGEDSDVSIKINKIYDIVTNLNYKDIIEFKNQVDEISHKINCLFGLLMDLDAIPFLFIFKCVYLPYKALIYRTTGDKESKESQDFNFLSQKTKLSLTTYSNLYNTLKNIKIKETDFSYLHLNCKTTIDNIADLSLLMCDVVINASDAKLTNEEKQVIYLFYKDVELLIWEYIALIEYLI